MAGDGKAEGGIPEGGDRREGRPPTFGEQLPQLFLFPLLIVVVGTMVYLFFIASGKDQRTIPELIADIETGGEHARKQDAYALAMQVKTMEPGEHLSRELTAKLLDLMLRFENEEELCTFLTLAAGRAGVPELTLPVMTRLASDAESPPQIRMNAVHALALSRSPDAAPVLKGVIATHTAEDQWEFRLRALAGLANMRHPDGAILLRAALGDGQRAVRWSAACWLANFYGDGQGIDTLESLVSWEFLDEQRGGGRPLSFDEKELYMIQALRGLAAVQGEKARPVLERLAKDERSPKVRDAAIRLLDADPDETPPDAVGVPDALRSSERRSPGRGDAVLVAACRGGLAAGTPKGIPTRHFIDDEPRACPRIPAWLRPAASWPRRLCAAAPPGANGANSGIGS